MPTTPVEIGPARTASVVTVDRLLRASGAGTATFVAGTLLMHAVQPELSPRNDAVSYYMNGRAGWVLGVGLVALGAGSLCLAAAVARLGGRNAGGRVGIWALALWGSGAAVGGVFRPDPLGHWDQPPSLSGAIHGLAAMVALLAFPVAALGLAGPLGRLARRADLARRLWWLAGLGAATLAVFVACLAPAFANRPPVLLGLVERVLLLLHATWLASAVRSLRGVRGIPASPR